MDVAVIGTGYVGLVTGTCFASQKNFVVCIDVDENKIQRLKNGEVPIYEPTLEELMRESKDYLRFSTNIKDIVDCDIAFICVGTPMDKDGSADLRYVLSVAKSIGEVMTKPLVVVDKSTVPVGTGEKVFNVIKEQLEKRNLSIDFQVVSNPEFLKEGSAVKDFLEPDRVIIGSDKPCETLRKLYSFVPSDRILEMNVKSAELTKYASNSMLATKISFINEIANICEKVNANINDVRNGMGMDKRIGFSFINPGCGYGGSCFPKDVQALIKTSIDNNYDAKILNAVEKTNNEQKKVLSDKVLKVFGNDLTNKRFAVWGLAFKPNTDDMRESPAITVISELQKHSATISAYDPKALKEAQKFLKNIDYKEDKYETLNDSDALIVVTDWDEFKNVNFDLIKNKLNRAIIFDGRNIYDKEELNKLGFDYHGIGC